MKDNKIEMSCNEKVKGINKAKEMNTKVMEEMMCVLNKYRREIIEKLSEKYGFDMKEALAYVEGSAEALPKEEAVLPKVVSPKVVKPKAVKEAPKTEEEKEAEKAKKLAEKEALKEAEKAKKLAEKEAEKAKKLTEKKPVKEKKAKAVEVEKVEKVEVAVEEAVEEEELDEEEIEEDEEEVEEVKLKSFTFNGKKYGRAEDNSVFDLETQEEIGVWNESKKEIDYTA